MATIDLLKQAKDALDKAQASKKQSQDVLSNLGPAVVDALRPSLEANSLVMKEGLSELAKAISELKINAPEVPKAQIEVTIPEIKVPTPQVTVNVSDIPAPIIPEIKIPKIVVPKPEVTVNVPPIKIPKLEWPNEKMPIEGWVQLMGVDLQHPLPVTVVNAKDIGGGGSAVIGGGGGGGIVTIGGALATVGVTLMNPDGLPTSISATITGGGSTVSLVNSDGTYYNSDNPLPITGSITTSPAPQVSGYADSVNVMQYGGVATPTGKNETTDGVFRTIQMTDSVSSVYVTGAANSTYAEIMNPDGRVKVELPTGSSGLTDTELRASPVPIQQVSGYSDSVNITNASLAVTIAATTIVDQVSGANWSVNVLSTVGLTDTQLRASTLDIKQVSGSIDSVNIVTSIAIPVTDNSGSLTVDVTDIFATTVASNVVNADNRVKVELPATTISSKTLDGAGTSIDSISGGLNVSQVSGASWSVSVLNATLAVTQSTSPWVVDGSAVVQPVSQVSGAQWSTSASQAGTWNIGTVTTVTGVTNSVAAAIIDSGGVQYSTTNPVPIGDAGGSLTIDGSLTGITNTLDVKQVSGANWSVSVLDFNGNAPATGLNETNGGVLRTVLMTDSVASVVVNSGTITTVTTVTGITNTVNVRLDSTDGAYTAANPFPISIASGALTSTIVVGDTLARVADTGAAPVKIGGIARQTNPTAFADGDRSNISTDDLGRQITRPVNARDLMQTAYATLSTGTETTLLAGAASTFFDLVYVMGANTSDAAVQVDIRSGTANGVVMTIEIPANGTSGVAPPVPIPQDVLANTWTADLPDITGTTVYLSALFSKEI